MALSYLPGVQLNAIDQVVQKGTSAFTLTQAGDQLGFFFIRNSTITIPSVELAPCAPRSWTAKKP